MKTLVGLGNPGTKYADTRHNVGRLLLEMLAKTEGFTSFAKDKLLQAQVSKGVLFGQQTQFVLPETFMNESGQTIRELSKRGVDVEDLVVVYDDLYLPFGTIKLSYDRGDGGHNGIISIVNHLGTKAFLRVRVGICPVDGETGELRTITGEARANFVLQSFTPNETTEIEKTILPKVREALELLATTDRAQATTVVNGKG